MNLAEKYRPKTWDAVRWQDKAVRTAKLLCDGGLGGHAVWISGRKGNGKTTIARLMAETFGAPWSIDQVSGGKLTMPVLEGLARSLAVRPMGDVGRVIIVNEAHWLKNAVIGELEDLLDPVPEWACWIFTTTIAGQTLFDDNTDAAPFLARCNRVELSQRIGAPDVAAYLKEIAEAHQLDGQPIDRYIRLVNNNQGDVRACLTQIESGEMLA